MKLVLPLVAILGLASSLTAGSQSSPLQTLAVQDGGRVKPLDTFARETARRISGARPFGVGDSIGHLEPAEWILAMLAMPERWRDEPMIRVSHAELRQAVDLSFDRDRYSFNELVSHEPLLRAEERIRERFRQDPEAKLSPMEQEISALDEKLSLIGGVFSGNALRLVPDPADPKGAWFSITDLEKDTGEGSRRIRLLAASLVQAYRGGDRLDAERAASALGSRLRQVAPASYPSDGVLRLEVRYNHLKPFRIAWLLYLTGFLVLLASFPLRASPLAWTGIAALIGGFSFHTYGMFVRTLISGRPPVTNMYESVVFVAWGAMLFALIFEGIYRARYFAACASLLAVACLIVADSVPILDGSIAPLAPVLRDNFWLTLHVLTITLGYAALLLAMGIGHVNLGLHFFAPSRVALFKTLSTFLYRALQVGTLLLATGTMLGGVWASYSWGRFWGWDPKETWALIALLGYLAILHGRFLGWFRDFGMAVGSIVAFLGVLMAWYGVNFVLGTGLHSYGFGSGGYAYVGTFVAFELAVVVGAALRRPKPLGFLAPQAGGPAWTPGPVSQRVS